MGTNYTLLGGEVSQADSTEEKAVIELLSGFIEALIEEQGIGSKANPTTALSKEGTNKNECA